MTPDTHSDGGSGRPPAGAAAVCALCKSALEPAPEQDESAPTRADHDLCHECFQSVLHIYA